MDPHVDENAAARFRVGIFEVRWKRIARRRLEDDRTADAAFVDLPFGRCVAGIEAAHETHLQKCPGSLFRRHHVGRVVQRNRRRLFAERRFLRRQRRIDDAAVRVRRADDYDRIDRAIGNQLLRFRIRSRHLEFGRHVLCQLRIGIGHGRQSRGGNPRAEIACVHPTEAAEPNQTDVETRHSLTFSSTMPSTDNRPQSSGLRSRSL